MHVHVYHKHERCLSVECEILFPDSLLRTPNFNSVIVVDSEIEYNDLYTQLSVTLC